MVGFNRRWAPLLVDLKRAWGERVGPHMVQFRVNAGRVDQKSWYADAATEGSRFVGEGGHFIDTVSWWLGADPVEVSAARASDDDDNLVVTLRYPDGSVGLVSYLTAGDARYPKELIEVFGQGGVAKLDNFGRTELWRNGKATTNRALGGIDKGQKHELAAFVEAVSAGGPMPVPLASVLATTHATIAAGESASAGVPRRVTADPRELAAAPNADDGAMQEADDLLAEAAAAAAMDASALDAREPEQVR
jgi:predicted dehydrogenase